MNGQQVSVTPTFSGRTGTITVPNVQSDLVIMLYPNPTQYTITKSLTNCYCDVTRNGNPLPDNILYYGDVLTIQPVTPYNQYASLPTDHTGDPRLSMPTFTTIATNWTTPQVITVTGNVKITANYVVPHQTITFYEFDGTTVID